jgi:hypothetical protein
MELAIPYQKFEISKLHIIPQTSGYLPFEYKDGDLVLHKSIVLTPTLKVINYYEDKGKIEFEADDAFIGKIGAMQEVLKSVIFLQQKLFFNENLTREQIDYGFKLLSYGNKFVCYIPSFIKTQHNMSSYNKWGDNKTMHVIDGDKSEHMALKDIFIPNTHIRIALKLGGIKIKSNSRGVNFFIDHNILHIWKV